MRLCDLDEIKICVDRQYKNCHGYSGNKKEIYREAILAVKSILHSAKPIDAVPVVHGRWIPFNESEISGFNPEFAGCDPIAGYRCSECGAEAILDCNDQFVLSKCCHDCGAKMEEGAD